MAASQIIENLALLSSRKWENFDRWGRCGMGLRLKDRRLARELVEIASVNSSRARAPKETFAVQVGVN